MPEVEVVDLMPPVRTQIRKPVRAVLVVVEPEVPVPEAMLALPERQILAAVAVAVDMLAAREPMAAQAAQAS
jgi:hypothetical protein